MRRTPLEEGLRWLEQANEDLKWVQLLAREGGYHLACFLSQQVVEKALKAFLYAQGEELVVGHSVDSLLARASKYEPRFEEKRSFWSCLDGYYIATRYPNGLPDSIPARVFNARLAQDAVELAQDAVAFVAGLLIVP
ncbi:MAG: HEPN domain-containing protein [Syntrophothermus sp.]|uniref:HEPN domain-containing protein n=1 Tax=Syntrophothermus sp. TaxID=2736299 RepID=UPI00257E6BB2|nr:HEPN domain-containing protein [Syntrophothermus sp.]NSW83110.1 HEPN domain-containing protein [Syntrophothermus sp.]